MDSDSERGVDRRRLLGWGGSPAALVTYGENLGGIAVIEQKLKPGENASLGNGSRRSEDQLPKVSVNGATGTELATALGTVVLPHFSELVSSERWSELSSTIVRYLWKAAAVTICVGWAGTRTASASSSACSMKLSKFFIRPTTNKR